MRARRRYRTLCDATFATAAAFARGGFVVVVDVVFERPELREVAERAFEEVPHHFVAVTCPLDVVDERERARGNRPIGLARRQADHVLAGSYTLTLDTNAVASEACVEAIMALACR